MMVLFSGLLFINHVHATNVASLINQDTTWSLSGSPYTLKGPTAVNKGVTLTIEPGVTVNLNDYYIQVNGTLAAKGSSSQHINFNGGRLVFTIASDGWNQQTGRGNIIEYATLNNARIESDNAIKLSNTVIAGSVNAGANSVLSNNDITCEPVSAVVVGDSSMVTGNTITGLLQTRDNTVIKHNNLKPGTSTGSSSEPTLSTAGSCTISDNTITGTQVSNFDIYAYALRTGGSSVITNNVINGIITGSPSEISGNTIEGGGTSYSWGFRDKYSVPVVRIDSASCKFHSNTIRGTTSAAVSARSVSFTSNIVSGSISVSETSEFKNNVISGAITGGRLFQNNKINGSINLVGAAIISQNYIERSTSAIYCNGFEAHIVDNTIIGGIYDAAGTIEHNLITDGYGITTSASQVTIQANIITKNTIGISVGSDKATILNNNIEGNTQNSIALQISEDVDAKGNWWGTTDTTLISDSIHDFKNDFNLGTVNYLPVLTAPNSQAGPRQNLNLPSATSLNPQASTTPTEEGSTSETFLLSILRTAIILWWVIPAVAAIIALVIVLMITRRKKSPPNSMLTKG